MSCSEIVTELAHNLDFLSTTLHDLPPRHRSLRRVFERSWQLLSGEEQEVLCQLSVFHGGFLREAAEAVAGLTLAMLSRFVDHSLVQRQSDGRFGLHELLRQFLGEKLHANPSHWEQAHYRHSAYYGTRFAKQGWFLGMAEEEPQPAVEAGFLPSAAEIDNVKAAWMWAVQHQYTPTIRHLMNPLADYYLNVGIREEGGRIFDEGAAAIRSADCLPQEEKDSLAASLLLRRSLLMGHNQHAKALKVLNESLSLLRQSVPEDQWEIALALVQRGITLARLGQNTEGVKSIEVGRAILQAQNHLLGVGYALAMQGTAELGWGRLGRAAESQAEAAKLLEGERGHQYWRVVHYLSNVYMLQGRYQQAEAHLNRVIDHYAKLHPPFSLLAFAWRNRGDLAVAMGNLDKAGFYFTEAKAHFERMGVGWNIEIPLVASAGVIARLQGDLEEAEHLLTKNLSTARQVGSLQRIANNLHNLARLRHDQGRYQEEKALLDEALQIARQADFRFATALVLCQLGHTALALHQPDVKRHYAEALRITTAEEIDRITLEVLTGVAQQLIQDHNGDFAVALLTFVQGHPASEFETKRKAHRLLVELETQLPVHQLAQDRQKGQMYTLQGIVSSLLLNYLEI